MRRPKQQSEHTISVICTTCGKSFIRFVSQIKDYKSGGLLGRLFCSRKCFQTKPSRWNERGYIKIPDRKNGTHRVNEHTIIAEHALGRKLKDRRFEIVHHINCDKTDNRNCNLLICDPSYHRWLHNRYGDRFAELHLRG